MRLNHESRQIQSENYIILTALLPEKYTGPTNPVTLTDHLYAARVKAGHSRLDTAFSLGVTDSTLKDWEEGKEPHSIYVPRIVHWLGFNPELEQATGLSEHLRAHRRHLGLTMRQYAKIIGMEKNTLASLESNSRKPKPQTLKKVYSFLPDFLSLT